MKNFRILRETLVNFQFANFPTRKNTEKRKEIESIFSPDSAIWWRHESSTPALNTFFLKKYTYKTHIIYLQQQRKSIVCQIKGFLCDTQKNKSHRLYFEKRKKSEFYNKYFRRIKESVGKNRFKLSTPKKVLYYKRKNIALCSWKKSVAICVSAMKYYKNCEINER